MGNLLQKHFKVTEMRSYQMRSTQTHFDSVGQVWDLTWLCDVLVTPQTVVTTDNEPGG